MLLLDSFPKSGREFWLVVNLTLPVYRSRTIHCINYAALRFPSEKRKGINQKLCPVNCPGQSFLHADHYC